MPTPSRRPTSNSKRSDADLKAKKGSRAADGRTEEKGSTPVERRTGAARHVDAKRGAGVARPADGAKRTGASRRVDGGVVAGGEETIPFELPRVSEASRERALRLFDALAMHYPDATCELNFSSPHELLVATILSAQSTDAGVNKATPALFARFATPADYAASTPEEIETYIRSIGLYRNKAKAIHAAMTAIVERHGGEVPRTMAELLELRGVARKTANVVLGNAFGINVGFVVDTHIERLAKRFGLAPMGANVGEVERRLMALVPRERWRDASHQLIWHGRRACKARGCRCEDHPVCARFGPCGPEGAKGARCEGCGGTGAGKGA